MHPALSAHAFDGLPFTLRRLATAALNGSAEDLSQCSATCHHHRHPDDDLDTYKNGTAFTRAFGALEGLVNVPDIPRAAFLDLRPRYSIPGPWKWHTRGDAECNEISLSFLDFIFPFGDDSGCTSLISATPGVRRAVGRAWTASLSLEDSELPSTWYPQLVHWILNRLNPSGPSSLEEYIQATGGSFNDLASLLPRHISRIVPRQHTELLELPGRSLLGLILFVVAADHINEADLSQNPSNDRRLPLSEALRRLGTTTLTVAACAASSADVPAASTIVANIFYFIALANRLPRAELCLAESIKHGLLYALVASARPEFSRHVFPQSKVLLAFVLPLYTIHRTVLGLMDEAFTEVQPIIRANNFASTELWSDWQKLIDLVAQRLSLLERLNSPGRILLKACANMACGRI
ncbi:hypothetical protein DFH06DRAFT_400563 [Mycena polygramma]|nr:hypothetical protein DFH06DRAFT_400563 [Mycena polygramma]